MHRFEIGILALMAAGAGWYIVDVFGWANLAKIVGSLVGLLTIFVLLRTEWS